MQWNPANGVRLKTLKLYIGAERIDGVEIVENDTGTYHLLGKTDNAKLDYFLTNDRSPAIPREFVDLRRLVNFVKANCGGIKYFWLNVHMEPPLEAVGNPQTMTKR